MTDTHTHLYMDDYAHDREAVVARCLEAGVTRLVLPCVTRESVAEMKAMHARWPENTVLALGLHPTELGPDWREELDWMESLLPGEYVAIGEVGLDLHWDRSQEAEQREAFSRQLGWADKYGLPVLIHCRDAREELLDEISRFKASLPEGRKLPQMVFHSFTGSSDEVKRIREVCDPWFGINGVVTFKNAPELREALKEIGIERILLETDSPWLSPSPDRKSVV